MIALLFIFLAGRTPELKPYPKVISQEWAVTLYEGRYTRGPTKVFFGEKEAYKYARDKAWSHAVIYRTDRVLVYER